MTDQTNHQHVSERLPDYVRGDLAASQKNLIEQHLAECSECTEELTGLRALLGAEIAEMNDVERGRLRATVVEALDPTEVPRDDSLGVWLPPRKSPWSRFAPTLGAAALVLIAVIGALNVGGLGGGNDEEPASGGGGGDRIQRRSEDRAGDEAGKPQSKGAPLQEEQTEGTTEDVSSGGEAETFAATLPRPKFVASGERTRNLSGFQADSAKADDLAGYVPENYLASYARKFTVADVAEREVAYLDLLVAKAPAEVDGRVRWCGNRVRAAIQEPILPAYGTVTDFDARRSLLLGFVYSDKPRGKLSNYMLWVWAGGCNEGFRHIQGTIRK